MGMASRLMALAALSCLSAGRASSMNIVCSSTRREASRCTGAMASLESVSHLRRGLGPAFVGLPSPVVGLMSRSMRGATCAGFRVAPPSVRLSPHSRKSALTTVCVFEQMTKGLGDLFGNNKNDVDALKKILVRCCFCYCSPMHLVQPLHSLMHLPSCSAVQPQRSLEPAATVPPHLAAIASMQLLFDVRR